MKKVFAIIAIAGSLVACNNSGENAGAGSDTATTTLDTATVAPVAGDTATIAPATGDTATGAGTTAPAAGDTATGAAH